MTRGEEEREMHPTRRTKLLGAGAAAVVLLVATGCGAPGGGSSASSGGGGSGPIKIAVIDEQSGQLSSLGKWEYDGVKLAVDQANASGGVNGRKLSLRVYDTQGDPTVATNLGRKAASAGYVAAMGTASSATTLAMAPIMKSSSIPEVTSGQSPKLAQLDDPFLFLNAPTSTTIDDTLAKYVVGTKHFKSIALISNNGAYGAGEHDAFLKSLASRGVKPVADQKVTPDQKDFSAALTSIRQKQPDALFIGAEEVESGLIVKQARELGIKATIVGGTPLATDVFLNTAGKAAAEGVITSSPYLSNTQSAAARKFAAAYKRKFGQTSELHGAKAYDGAEILIQALKSSRAATGRKLAEAMRSVRYDGLLGHYRFDQRGVGLHESRIGVVRGGVVKPVSP